MTDSFTCSFTPGSWAVIPRDDDEDPPVCWDVFDNGGEVPSSGVACDIFNEANATLIAAAPDLLEALEYIVHSLSPVAFGSWAPEGVRPEFRVGFDRAKAAIAKATGNGNFTHREAK